MLRTAPNFSNIRNRVPAHISRHQTFDIVAGFVGKDNLPWNIPLTTEEKIFSQIKFCFAIFFLSSYFLSCFFLVGYHQHFSESTCQIYGWQYYV